MQKIVLLCALLAALGLQTALAAPKYRVKRSSDSYLADLETRIALKNMKGVAVTMPVAGGRFDPNKLGRKRRSQARFLDVLFNQSEEDNGDPRDRIEYQLFLKRLQSLL